MFGCVVITSRRKKKASKKLLEKTLSRGFIFSEEVIANYNEKILMQMADNIGLSEKQLNSTFHESWEKVKSADDEQLIIEQLMHYITTYGFESLGCYDEQFVYIPNKNQENIDINFDKVPLRVIHGCTEKELKQKCIDMLNMGVALKNDTLDALFEILQICRLTHADFENVRNKEASALLMDMFNMIPHNPDEFLRYLMYKTKGSALLIKNKYTYRKISENMITTSKLLEKYVNQRGIDPLARVFYRHKPIFMAIKHASNTRRNARLINQIRRRARKVHAPMQKDMLNSLTERIKNHERIDFNKFNRELAKTNIFRKIRLLYAIRYRMQCPESIMFKIRNGKSFAKELPDSDTIGFQTNRHVAERIYNRILERIVEDVRKKVHNKKIYIPQKIMYTLPSSEKQFCGNFPSGTRIETGNDSTVAIHWHNVDKCRIDLDLSALTTSQKIGWDAEYRNSESSLLLSGDMTTAPEPEGAVEAIKCEETNHSEFPIVFNVNYYNYNANIEVPFSVMVVKNNTADKMMRESEHAERSRMVTNEKIVAKSDTKMDEKQKIIGMLDMDYDGQHHFYFIDTNIANTITTKSNNTMYHARNYIAETNKNAVKLGDVLMLAGAKIVTNPDKKEECDIDLSPENIEKDTILDILT